MSKNFIIDISSEPIPITDKNHIDFRVINKKNITNNFFILDLNSLDKTLAKKFIKKLLKLKNKTNIGVYNQDTDSYLVTKIYNYNNKNELHHNIVDAIYAIFKENIKETYSYIYNTVCDNLDKEFIEKNLCEFKDDRCGEKRNTSCMVGCCRHYKNKLWGPLPFNKFVVCEYLKDKRCSAKCLSCKLFTCDYLNKKGVKFKINNIFLLDTFFNIIQKFILKTSVYTPKEKIIKKLLLFR